MGEFRETIKGCILFYVLLLIGIAIYFAITGLPKYEPFDTSKLSPEMRQDLEKRVEEDRVKKTQEEHSNKAIFCLVLSFVFCLVAKRSGEGKNFLYALAFLGVALLFDYKLVLGMAFLYYFICPLLLVMILAGLLRRN